MDFDQESMTETAPSKQFSWMKTLTPINSLSGIDSNGHHDHKVTIFLYFPFIKALLGNRTIRTTIVSCAFSFLSDLANFSQNSEILVAENLKI